VGWRERDYGRFDETERDAFLGSSRTRPPRRRSRRVDAGLLLAVGLSGAVFAANQKLHLFSFTLSRNASPPAARAKTPNVVAPQPDVVSIHWNLRDLTPAPNAGRICVATSSHGRICAAYVVGERPADNLTREIQRRGLRVQSSA
jgi:hypothetical protein